MMEYPALFALEKRKNVLVSACHGIHNGCIGWTWRWISNVLTTQEKLDLDHLCSRLQSVAPIATVADGWRWGNDNQHQFSTSSIKQLLGETKRTTGCYINGIIGRLLRSISLCGKQCITGYSPLILLLEGAFLYNHKSASYVGLR